MFSIVKFVIRSVQPAGRLAAEADIIALKPQLQIKNTLTVDVWDAGSHALLARSAT